MPELPEVETIVRDLRRWLVGRTITGAEIYWPRTIATPDVATFRAALLGQRIVGVDRRAKFIIIRLERGALLIHLRMTGQLLLAPADSEPDLCHLRVALTLDGQRLLFRDTRKFGRMCLVDDPEATLAGLGPEPLESSFTAEELGARLHERRGPIKSLLLDQRILAGLGNIYADEALYAAGIAPQRRACTLGRDEIAALHKAIREELERGIRNRGTTLSDYLDAEGRRGNHGEHLWVHGRAGQLCRRCGSAIVRSRVGGRSSYHCPGCQK